MKNRIREFLAKEHLFSFVLGFAFSAPFVEAVIPARGLSFLFPLAYLAIFFRSETFSFFTFPNLMISGDYLFTSSMGLAVIMVTLVVSHNRSVPAVQESAL